MDRTPIRIQRRRTEGWKMEEQGVRPFYCGRPGPFGNPFKLGSHNALARTPAADLVTPWEYEGRVTGPGQHDMVWPSGAVTEHHIRFMTRDETIATYRRALIAPTPALHLFHRPGPAPAVRVDVDMVRRELAGRDLLCWCRLDQNCHVDVLLWVANAPEHEIKEASQDEYEIIRRMAERVAQLHPEVLCALRDDTARVAC